MSFQINNWEIKKFLRVVLVIQFALWGVIGLDVIGIDIPILRQLIAFIYLTFVPGIIIIRILKLNKLGNIETLLYTVGLSIATLMFTGLFMNMIYPFFGIQRPISTTPLVITISTVVLILCVLCYVRNKDFSTLSYNSNVDIRSAVSPPALLLCLLPFLSIFGTYFVNFYNNNILLMFLIVIIALIVVLIGFDKFIPKKLNPLAVFSIALSLLFHTSLISMYIWGWDIHYEYYISKFVIANSLWNPTISSNVNAMLSIVMLAPIYSIISNLDLIWVFKIIYPALFALVPVGLYRVFQKQTNDKIAFLSSFLFMSVWMFYIEMPQMARIEIAELFLVLLILLMFDRNIYSTQRRMLSIIFAFSLVVSHYGLSYITMFIFTVSYGLLFLNNWFNNQKMTNTYTLTFVLIYITLAITWYIHVSSSSAFDAIVRIGDQIADSIFTEFLSQESVQGLNIVTTKTVSPLHEITKIFHLITQFFIGVGLITLLLKRKDMKIDDTYVAFSVVNFSILLASLSVPYFASALNTTRFYQITLIFLSPLYVIGGMTVFRVLTKNVRISLLSKNTISLRVLAVLLAIFLLLNTGFIYEVAQDDPTSIALSSYVDNIAYNKKDATGAQWISLFVNRSLILYGDAYGMKPLGDWVYNSKRYIMSTDVKQMQEDGYIYFRSWNTLQQEGIIFNKVKAVVKIKRINFEDVPEFLNMIGTKNKIYNNGGSQIFAPSEALR